MSESAVGNVRTGILMAARKKIRRESWNAAALRQLLEQVRAGEMTADAAMETLKHLPFEQMEHSTLIIIGRCGRGFAR